MVPVQGLSAVSGHRSCQFDQKSDAGLAELHTRVHRKYSYLALKQTIFGNLSETASNEPVTPGYGEGSFVVIRGRKEGEKWSKGLILIY